MEHQFECRVNYKPTPAITISTGPGMDRSRGNSQYVTSQADSTATKTFGNRYVFAEIDQFDVNLTTRVNWIFSPKMSFQVYTQPYIRWAGIGNSKNWRIRARTPSCAMDMKSADRIGSDQNQYR